MATWEALSKGYTRKLISSIALTRMWVGLIDCRCYGTEKKPVPEEYIWLVWECLARGLCVLAYGNENLSGPRWLHPEIGHFDIKPNNSKLPFSIAKLGLTDLDSIGWKERRTAHATGSLQNRRLWRIFQYPRRATVRRFNIEDGRAWHQKLESTRTAPFPLSLQYRVLKLSPGTNGQENPKPHGWDADQCLANCQMHVRAHPTRTQVQHQEVLFLSLAQPELVLRDVWPQNLKG